MVYNNQMICNINEIKIRRIDTNYIDIRNQQQVTKKQQKGEMKSSNKNIKYLLIKLQQIQMLSGGHKDEQECVYYSFSINDDMYFSSCVGPGSEKLNDDIIIAVGQKGMPQCLQLCRWENHMIMFTHYVDILELNTRATTMKHIQTKAGQVLKMFIAGLNHQQLIVGTKFIPQISQHYLIIESISVINNTINKNQTGPSFLQVKTSSRKYIIPVLNGKTIIKIPQTFQFFRIQNNKQIGKSSLYKYDQLIDTQTTIDLAPSNGYKFDTKLKLNLKWGINFLQPKTQNILLLESQQIMMYDFEAKFDNYNQFGNVKLKFVIGTKAFELGNDFNSAKPAKIKKIINFFTKSQDEDVTILVQKNLKVISQSKFHIQELSSYVVNVLKKKIIDVQGKQIGNLKFKGEKSKNLSTPSNNKFWRQSLKNKNLNTMGIFAIYQVSAKQPNRQGLSLILKTQNDQKIMENVPNFLQFDKNQLINQNPIILTVKQDQSIYMMIKRSEESNQQQIKKQNSDFIGIALYNIAQTKFGMNCAQIKFYKNQILTVTVNCMIQKIFSYPFIKPTFQPQILQALSHKSISLSLVMKQIYFSPYFHTYQYDNKNEVYCIVEINKIKKVLIMENKNKNQLSFTQSSSSDSLDFNIEQCQIIRIKITFLVSDIGQDQQIYGWSLIKIKTSQLQSATTALKYYLVQIKNQFGNNVGQLNFQIYKAPLFNSHARQSRDVLESGNRVVQGQNRKLKMHLAKISQSVQIKQKPSIQKIKNKTKQTNQIIQAIKAEEKSSNAKISIPNRYDKKAPSLSGERKPRNKSMHGIQSSLKLPAIKQQPSSTGKNRNSLNQLVQMMKIRKRSVKGHYQQNSMLQSYQAKYFNDKNKIRGHSSFDNSAIDEDTHLKQRIEKQNPNIERNMQILFPKKTGRIQKNISLKKPISQDQEKLRGLKSVMSEISQDMREIQPTQKDQEVALHIDSKESYRHQQIHQGKNASIQMHGPEWQDNQFAM